MNKKCNRRITEKNKVNNSKEKQITKVWMLMYEKQQKIKLAKNQNQPIMNPVKIEKQTFAEGNILHEIKENNPEEENQRSSLNQTIKKEEQQKQIDYYQQFCKLYLANAVLETHLKQLTIEKSELLGKLHKLEKKAEENLEGNSNSNTDRKKRIRRSAADIARHYKCSHDNCSKSYGSEGSLNQHIKLKHPDYFKTLNIPQSMMLREYGDESISDSRQ